MTFPQIQLSHTHRYTTCKLYTNSVLYHWVMSLHCRCRRCSLSGRHPVLSTDSIASCRLLIKRTLLYMHTWRSSSPIEIITIFKRGRACTTYACTHAHSTQHAARNTQHATRSTPSAPPHAVARDRACYACPLCSSPIDPRCVHAL